jgi:Glycosyltransferase family 87/WD40-like Beta Propeller Repeat
VILHAPLRQRVIEGVAFALLCLYLTAHTLPRAWQSLNTDFPNYYLTARLTREGVDPARAYEWIWLQREKDHRNIDQRIVGLVPITPFSTLAMWPMALLPPLVAKHIWIVFNLALLFPIAFLLRSITGLSLLHLGILFAMSFPLHRNLLFGQYYVLLLAILTAACWAAQRRYSWLAGALVALGIAVKIFPILLVLYFLRKKDWKALSTCILVVALALLASIAVFGWGLHRTYFLQVLPWTLRGECLDPYSLTSSSISSVLHRLFIYEPQWNAHPALHAPWLVAILLPIMELALLAPALLWIDPEDSSPERVPLEWSVLLFTTLAISPLPASYHFTVLILPMAALCAHLLRGRRIGLLAAAILLYLAVGYPGWNTSPGDGWRVLLHVPRLYALVVLTSVALYALRKPLTHTYRRMWWYAGITAILAFSIFSGLQRQRHLFDDYAYRLPMPPQAFFAAQPAALETAVHIIALLPTGYRAANIDSASTHFDGGPYNPSIDQLSFTSEASVTWTEEVAEHSLLRSSIPATPSVMDAESPASTPDGRTLAFLREIGGRKHLFARQLDQPDERERELTPDSAWNVEEVALAPSGSIIMAATHNSASSGLYVVSGTGRIDPINVGDARYPAVSPDGRWLAFSGLQSGNWNLYLREIATGATRRLTNSPCNQIEPAWEADSKTLLYGSDCGRSLWFTAICRRRVLQ